MTKPTIVETREDPLSGDVTLYLSDGRAIRLDRREYQLDPLSWWADSAEVASDNRRVDVVQYGRKVGELPDYWHPGLAHSQSRMFDYRPGDLTLRDGKWHAAPGLGAGDLDCLVGFVRKEQTP